MNREMLYLNKSDIKQVGGDHSQVYADALTEALTAHAHNDFVQPFKPYLRQDPEDGHIADQIIVMPSYISGEHAILGIKWIGSRHDNPSKCNMERAGGVITLSDPETNYPIAVMEASLTNSMRTVTASVITAKHLAKKELKDLTIIDCGLIGDKQLQNVLEQFDHIGRVFIYDRFPEACARFVGRWQQQRLETNFIATENAREAVSNGEIAATYIITDQLYIEYGWL